MPENSRGRFNFKRKDTKEIDNFKLMEKRKIEESRKREEKTFLSFSLKIARNAEKGKRPSYRKFRKNPLVSIIIPCYNQGIYLDECVDSVLKQTYKNYEIIIINDFSTDDTPQYIEKQLEKSEKIRIINHKVNKGLPATRNSGINSALGKYVLPLDADDKIYPNCIEKFVDAAEDDKGDIIYGGTQLFGVMSGSGMPRPYNFEKLKQENLMQCTALFQKKYWKEVGGYKEEMRNGYEDWEFWLNMGKHKHYGYGVKEILFCYRKKENSMVIQAENIREQIITQLKSFHPDIFGDNYKNDEKEKVSVIIPCFNHGKYLDDSVNSVLKQTYQNFEIIIIDDKSIDNSKEDIKNQLKKDDRIKAIYNEENLGPAETRNNGIKNATGKYILPLDADDKLNITAIEKFVKVLNTSSYDMVTSWYEKFGINTGIIRPQYSFQLMIHSNCGACCTMFYKKYWEEIGGYKSCVNGYEDWELWINMGKNNHHLFVIQEVLFYYRTARKSVATEADKKRNVLIQKIKELHPELYNKKKVLIPKNIKVFAICYNEEKMLPFFLRYYSNFADEIVIYDNYSTDNSLQIISKFPKAKVIKYDSKGLLDDKKYLEIKNNCWKESKDYDWVIIVDLDEYIYHDNILNLLKNYAKSGITIPKTNGYNMVTDLFPIDDGYSDITNLIKTGVERPNYCKSAIFSPKYIEEINYGPGAHKINPIGTIKYSRNKEIKFLHYKYFGLDYFRERAKLYAPRLKGINFDWGQMEYLKQVNADINLYNKWAEPNKAVIVI